MVDEDRIADWVSRINQCELASLATTVQSVQRVVGDERSSFHQLSQVVLKDSALSAKLLKIANSPAYAVCAEPVTTVTRATSLLGFDTVRSVCITSRLLDALLGEEKLAPAVAERMLNRIAASLHAAIQARMMMRGAHSRIREEVFLGALLDQIGESAFWSLGQPEVVALEEELSRPGCMKATAIRAAVGGSFADLSAALVRSWGLAEAVELSGATGGRPEARAIRLANELAEIVAVDGWQPSQLQHVYAQMAVLMNVAEEDAAHLARSCGKEAQELSACFGAGLLARRMVKRAEAAAVSVEPAHPAPAPPAAADTAPAGRSRGNADVQARALHELAAMPTSQTDTSTVLQLAMDGVHAGIGMDRTITALLNPERTLLQTRLWLGSGGQEWSNAFRFDVVPGKNIFHECLTQLGCYRFNSAAQGSLLRLVPRELLQFCEGRDFLLGPIAVGARAIGVIYADRTPSGRAISEQDFTIFRELSLQLRNSLARLTLRGA